MKYVLNLFLSKISWFFSFYMRNPRFESYVKGQDKLNRAFFNQKKNIKNNELDRYVSLNLIPKKIWLYWHAGEDAAPFIVKQCLESWRKHNPEWDIVVLDNINVRQYVDMPKLSEKFPVRYYANLLRLRLLQKYGGVWTDATTYCHRPLDEWLPLLATSGFFVYRNPGPDRIIENWFIASSPQNTLTIAWVQALEKYYLSIKKTNPAYFVAFYVFQWLVINDKKIKHEFDLSSGLSAHPSFLLKDFLTGKLGKNIFIEYLNAGLTVSKLDWRLDMLDENLLRRLNLLNNEISE